MLIRVGCLSADSQIVLLSLLLLVGGYLADGSFWGPGRLPTLLPLAFLLAKKTVYDGRR